MQISDNIYLGTAFAAGPITSDGSSPTELGVGPMGRVYVFDAQPLVLNTAGLAVSANPASGASFVLSAAGTDAVASTVNNQVRYTLGTARNVTITAAGANTATYTISGFDIYGQAMSQTLAAPSTSTVATTKAFKSIVSVTNANATAGASGLTVGYGDVIGIPVRMLTKDYTVGCVFNAIAVALTAVTGADTATATATTGDVRGTVALPSVADGVKRLVITVALPAIASGPTATRIGAFGVVQF